MINMGNLDMKRIMEKTNIKWIGAKNDKITEIKRLIKGNYPDSERLFVAEGIWAHQRLVNTQIEIKSFILCPECIYSDEATQLVKTFTEKDADVYAVSRNVFERLSERDKPDGLLSVGMIPFYKKEDLELKDAAVILILDGLENPGNIGTILRTCDGAGVDAIFICNKRARMTNPKLIKSSMGAVFVIPIIEFSSTAACISWLKKYHFNIYLADTKSTKTFKEFEYKGRSALVVGSEKFGVSDKWYSTETQKLVIPMLGVCDSLNVGTATSICIYEICMKRLTNTLDMT
ncbi:TrmH family RNA methyltransferase [Bacillus sp. SD088]|uniref:TrmH family RNA methyltransferase n=1 Tax=Bacillus sp. SD088 TaxID=2782012 RepID=UPI001A96C6F0|nr:TrmH family RNA methyltransferase [Bacillus sp. SD088]MBO0992678.1 hypothetical protein [Bacillus sp. SD088]